MRHRFVVPRKKRNPARMLCACVAQRPFDGRIAGAQHRQLRRQRYQRVHERQDQVDTLLMREPTNDSKKGHIGRVEAELSLERRVC